MPYLRFPQRIRSRCRSCGTRTARSTAPIPTTSMTPHIPRTRRGASGWWRCSCTCKCPHEETLSRPPGCMVSLWRVHSWRVLVMMTGSSTRGINPMHAKRCAFSCKPLPAEYLQSYVLSDHLQHKVCVWGVQCLVIIIKQNVASCTCRDKWCLTIFIIYLLIVLDKDVCYNPGIGVCLIIFIALCMHMTCTLLQLPVEWTAMHAKFWAMP